MPPCTSLATESLNVDHRSAGWLDGEASLVITTTEGEGDFGDWPNNYYDLVVGLLLLWLARYPSIQIFECQLVAQPNIHRQTILIKSINFNEIYIIFNLILIALYWRRWQSKTLSKMTSHSFSFSSFHRPLHLTTFLDIHRLKNKRIKFWKYLAVLLNLLLIDYTSEPLQIGLIFPIRIALCALWCGTSNTAQILEIRNIHMRLTITSSVALTSISPLWWLYLNTNRTWWNWDNDLFLWSTLHLLGVFINKYGGELLREFFLCIIFETHLISVFLSWEEILYYNVVYDI